GCAGREAHLPALESRRKNSRRRASRPLFAVARVPGRSPDGAGTSRAAMNDQRQAYLMIGTPAYNGMVHVDFVHSLMSIAAAGIRYTLVTTGGESLITRARNGILSRCHFTPECAHLLFLDGDTRVSGESIRRLLSHERDVIGAPVPLKTLPGREKVFNVGKVGDPTASPAQ